jgi:D-alanyl-D-alanine carboxypeptidase
MLLVMTDAHPKAGVKRLDKVSAPEPSVSFRPPSVEDIPVALRESPKAVPKKKVNRWALWSGLTGIGLLALGAGALVAVQLQRPRVAVVPNAKVANAQAPSGTNALGTNSTPETMLNHFHYDEAPKGDLAPIVPDGSIKLRKAAAQAYQQMDAAAQRDGINLVPLSGFRSLTDQDYLFFGKKAERGQVAAERAKVSAPPGYSEHHTGYALDIGDGSVPATELSPTFDNTRAYRWLQANAAFYSFELSFPKANKQGVSYEPWHWRFVGDRKSLETFYKARLKK